MQRALASVEPPEWVVVGLRDKQIHLPTAPTTLGTPNDSVGPSRQTELAVVQLIESEYKIYKCRFKGYPTNQLIK